MYKRTLLNKLLVRYKSRTFILRRLLILDERELGDGLVPLVSKKKRKKKKGGSYYYNC